MAMEYSPWLLEAILVGVHDLIPGHNAVFPWLGEFSDLPADAVLCEAGLIGMQPIFQYTPS